MSIEISAELINELKEFIGSNHFWIHFNSIKTKRSRVDNYWVNGDDNYDVILNGITVQLIDHDTLKNLDSMELFKDYHDYHELDEVKDEIYKRLGAVKDSKYSLYYHFKKDGEVIG